MKTNLIILLFLTSLTVFSQNRIEKPIQVHLNASGLFLKAFGNSLADSEIDELNVSKWELPGVSIGYHINKRWYIGYAFQPNRNISLKEPWAFGTDEHNGNIEVNHQTGNFHTIESRYFPFKFDLYGSFFFTHTSKAEYSMDFARTGIYTRLGSHLYETDLLAQWDFKSLNTFGLGLGYNFVHKNGFSFDLGLGLPFPLNEPLHENIEITPHEEVPILPSDIAEGIQKIENELFYFPVQLHLNIGYNF